MWRTRIYRIWTHLKDRCDNPNHHRYHRYGGRGIKYDPRWKDFAEFYLDMKHGYSDNLTIERIDSDRGYFKNNCRWATLAEQSRNRPSYNRLHKVDGELLSVAQWAKKTGKSLHIIRNRVYRLDHGLPVRLWT